VTTVINVKDHQPYDVYIGRPNGRWRLKGSKWACPYVPGRDGDRDAVLARYEAHVRGRPDLMAALPELRGKTLACWCTPLPCHGDVLVRLLAELDRAADRDPASGGGVA
jgi:hypothetical protein